MWVSNLYGGILCPTIESELKLIQNMMQLLGKASMREKQELNLGFFEV